MLTGLRFFYNNVAQQEVTVDYSIGKKPRKLPTVLPMAQVWKIICVPKNLKHCLILMSTYAAGLRASEVIGLKPEHIDTGLRSQTAASKHSNAAAPLNAAQTAGIPMSITFNRFQRHLKRTPRELFPRIISNTIPIKANRTKRHCQAALYTPALSIIPPL